MNRSTPLICFTFLAACGGAATTGNTTNTGVSGTTNGTGGGTGGTSSTSGGDDALAAIAGTTVLATTSEQIEAPDDMFVDSTHVYYLVTNPADNSCKTIFRVAKSGGTIEHVAASRCVTGVAVTEGFVVLSDEDLNVVVITTSGGALGAETVKATNVIGNVFGVSADGTKAYVALLNLAVVSLSTGMTLASTTGGTSGISQVFLGSTHIGFVRSGAATQVFTVPADLSSAPTQATLAGFDNSNSNKPVGVGMFGGYFYVNSQVPNKLRAIPEAGGTPIAVADVSGQLHLCGNGTKMAALTTAGAFRFAAGGTVPATPSTSFGGTLRELPERCAMDASGDVYFTISALPKGKANVLKLPH